MKKVIGILLVFAFMISLVACGNSSSSSSKAEGKTADSQIADVDSTEKTVEKSKKKSVEEDDDLGLMNVKIQDTDGLSDIEKLIVRYFDNDYFRPGYDDLQRYPQIFRGSQIWNYAMVSQIIESNDTDYTILVEYGTCFDPYYSIEGDHDEDNVFHSGKYAVLKGKQGDSRMVDGDLIQFYGKYVDAESYSVDGKSLYVPTILVNTWCVLNWEEPPKVFSMKEIRSMAQYLFGDDINIMDRIDWEVREGIEDSGYWPGEAYVVELDNQSNANFSYYEFGAQEEGYIADLKARLSGDYSEKRSISFSADFQNFYVQIFNTELKTYSINCYDLGLNKLWSRSFDEATSALLDYTSNHLYLAVNGYLYILDAETGEDSVEKKYIGEKVALRKVKDGIILVSNAQSDAFMKTDLQGNVLWTVNAKGNMTFGEYDFSSKTFKVNGLSLWYNPVIQIVNGNYVVPYNTYETRNSDGSGYEMYDYSGYYTIVISPDGDVVFETDNQISK